MPLGMSLAVSLSNSLARISASDALATAITDLKAAGKIVRVYKWADLTSTYIGTNGGDIAGADDVTGTVLEISDAVAAGQTVGDFVAASPELVDTANDAAAWTPASSNMIEDDGDDVKFTRVASSAGGTLDLDQTGGLSQDLVAGNWYVVTLNTRVETGSINIEFYSGSEAVATEVITSATNVPVHKVFKYSTGTPTIKVTGVGLTEIVYISAISVKELTGPPIIAPSDSERPVRKTSGGHHFGQFNGVDQGLEFGADLGAVNVVIAAIRTSDTRFMLINHGGTFGTDAPLAVVSFIANGSDNSTALGTATTTVDGAPLPAETRGGLHTAVADGSAHVVAQSYTGDFTSGSNPALSGYSTGGWRFEGDIAFLAALKDPTPEQIAVFTQAAADAFGVTLP